MSLTGSAGRTLTIYLAADSDKFKRGMADAERSTGKLKGKLGGLTGSLKANLGPALMGAGIAAGAAAVKFGVDGVKAAMEDQVAAEKLAKTMENLGLSMDTQAVEDMISKMSVQYGVADDKLRPAFERLVRATKDTSDAQDLLSLAMDVSAGTGKDLETVTNALGKASEGSTTAIGKLGTGLDKATIKSGDMKVITEKLSDTFSGQASAKAETWQGKIDSVKVAFDELSEAFGTGFLDGLDNANTKGNSLADTLVKLQTPMEQLGTDLGNVVSQSQYLFDVYGLLTGGFEAADGKWNGWGEKIGAFGDVIRTVVTPWEQMRQNMQFVYDLITRSSNLKLPSWVVSMGRIFGQDWSNGPLGSDVGQGAGGGGGSWGSPDQATGQSDAGDAGIMNQHGRPTRSRSVNINVNTGVGDPLEIGRQVRRVLELERRRTG